MRVTHATRQIQSSFEIDARLTSTGDGESPATLICLAPVRPRSARLKRPSCPAFSFDVLGHQQHATVLPMKRYCRAHQAVNDRLETLRADTPGQQRDQQLLPSPCRLFHADRHGILLPTSKAGSCSGFLLEHLHAHRREMLLP